MSIAERPASVSRLVRMVPARLAGPLVAAVAIGSAALADRPAAPESAPSATARDAASQVLGLLESTDPDLRGVALDRVRHGLAGTWFTADLLALLPTLPPAGQAALLDALADRGDPAALPAGRRFVAAERSDIRAAALALLGRCGGAAEIPALVAAVSEEGEVAAAARLALLEIQGPGSAEAVRAAAGSADGPLQARLIEVLIERRDRAAVPVFLAAADGPAAARSAALRALGRFGGPNEIDAMVRGMVQSTGDDRRAAEQALVAACTSGPSAAAAAAALTDGFAAAEPSVQDAVLPVLARIGGPSVLAIVDGLLSDPATRQRGLDALARWPDATVADRLLGIHAESRDPVERQAVLAALIRIAPLPDNGLDDAGRLALCREALALCESDADRGRVLERSSAIRSLAAFEFIAAYLDDPQLAEAACRGVVELAHDRTLRDAHKPAFLAALDKVLATTKNPELVERANRYKAGKTWDRKQKS